MTCYTARLIEFNDIIGANLIKDLTWIFSPYLSQDCDKLIINTSSKTQKSTNCLYVLFPSLYDGTLDSLDIILYVDISGLTISYNMNVEVWKQVSGKNNWLFGLK